ncbi:MAG TPA: IclR family transcriptional regulator [Gemmatimonadaceae bacterium]
MLRKAMEVLELFSPTRRELGVIEVAQALGRPKSTVSRWMSAIAAAGFLDRDPESGRYRLSIRVAVLGELARRSTSLQRVAREELRRLTAVTRETSSLAILVDREGMNVEAVESPHPIMHVGWVGRRFPCHATAAGKSLLAWREAGEVRQLLPKRLPRLASRTITDIDAFLHELGRVRDRGYSTAWRELEDDLAAVGAPVLDHTGAVVGAVAVSAPVSRAPLRSLAALSVPVVRAAQSISEQLGYRRARAG